MTSADSAPPSWVEYEDRAKGLRMRCPTDWSIRRGSTALLVSFVAPAAQISTFVSNLNVVRRANDKTESLDGLTRAASADVRRLLTDVHMIDLDSAVVAGNSARRLLFGYRQGVYGLTGEQWLFADAKHIWTITAGASNRVYPQVADVFAAIVSSISVDERDE